MTSDHGPDAAKSTKRATSLQKLQLSGPQIKEMQDQEQWRKMRGRNVLGKWWSRSLGWIFSGQSNIVCYTLMCQEYKYKYKLQLHKISTSKPG